MRRVQTWTSMGGTAVAIHKRDYRLMLAVLRAAESVAEAHNKNDSTRTIAMCHLTNQFHLFNGKGARNG